jgi:hypothetical protein
MNRQRVVSVVALSLVGVAAIGCTSGGSTPEKTPTTPPSSVATSGSGAPEPSVTFPPAPDPYRSPPSTLPTGPVALDEGPAPWPAPAVTNGGAGSADYVAAAGLPYGEETTQVHYHVHLDVIVNGQKVPVPAYLGFVVRNEKAVGLAPLHVHDTSQVVHIENSVEATFVLGQVFVEWGVRFTDRCLGSYCTGNGKELAVFVNGKRYSGDPTRLVLASHQEIAIEYGDSGSLPTPPSSYDFPGGE